MRSVFNPELHFFSSKADEVPSEFLWDVPSYIKSNNSGLEHGMQKVETCGPASIVIEKE